MLFGVKVTGSLYITFNTRCFVLAFHLFQFHRNTLPLFDDGIQLLFQFLMLFIQFHV